ncbi:MAG: NAD-dependent protein deacylase, partial [Lachnospiraceae bacterium]|nr:NAD-dependent protein deacylase [Lachnospiraceae bacterium]
TDGLYNQNYDYPPEYILSHTFFERNPEEFYRFYWDKMIAPGAKPNAAHRTLAKWERDGKLTAVVTQNIDGLHQMAGSRAVYELHGTVHRNHCVRCGRAYSLEEIPHEGVPRCSCGGIIKPDVVLYEEGLPDDAVQKACENIAAADLLIIGGTSLSVYPAAGFVNLFHGKHLVLINRTPTPMDAQADLVISDSIGKVLGVFL